MKNKNEKIITINVSGLGGLLITSFYIVLIVIKLLLEGMLWALMGVMYIYFIAIMPFTKLLQLIFPKYIEANYSHGLTLRNKLGKIIFRVW